MREAAERGTRLLGDCRADISCLYFFHGGVAAQRTAKKPRCQVARGQGLKCYPTLIGALSSLRSLCAERKRLSIWQALPRARRASQHMSYQRDIRTAEQQVLTEGGGSHVVWRTGVAAAGQGKCLQYNFPYEDRV